MDQHARGGGTPMAAGRNRTAISSHSETRTVWLPDEWAVYIANAGIGLLPRRQCTMAAEAGPVVVLLSGGCLSPKPN